MSKGLVRVWNDNIHDHTEKFRGQMVVIPAGKYVEMQAEDAVLFKSQFTPIIRNKGGRDDPRGFKKIRIEYNPTAADIKDAVADHEQAVTCQACGYGAKTQADLLEHIKTNHASQMVDTDAREALTGA